MNLHSALVDRLVPTVRYIRTYLIEATIEKERKISEISNADAEKASIFFDELRQLRLNSKIIKKAIEMAAVWPVGGMTTPARGPVVYVLCRLMKPKTIVETGVSSGVSSLYILEALEKNGEGHLYSIDYHCPSDRLPSGWLVPERLHDRWTMTLAKSSERLKPILEEIDSTDIFLHDSDHSHENMMFEFKTAWPHIREGGLLLSDDTHTNQSFFDFAREVNRKPTMFYLLGAIRK